MKTKSKRKTRQPIPSKARAAQPSRVDLKKARKAGVDKCVNELMTHLVFYSSLHLGALLHRQNIDPSLDVNGWQKIADKTDKNLKTKAETAQLAIQWQHAMNQANAYLKERDFFNAIIQILGVGQILGEISTKNSEPYDNHIDTEIKAVFYARERWRSDKDSRDKIFDWRVVKKYGDEKLKSKGEKRIQNLIADFWSGPFHKISEPCEGWIGKDGFYDAERGA
jgi:hypothetical protein